jgi:tetratricopeptide (TPR) repeat protein
MKTCINILFLLLSFALTSKADTNEILWKEANTCFKNKQYDSAALFYEKLTVNKPENAALYYNLGNTYYKLNKIGPAVLNYERALRIKPDYIEARENLALTHNRISNNISATPEIFFIKWWETLSNEHTNSIWSVLALLSFIVALGLLARRKYFKTSLHYGAQINGFLFFAFALFLVMAWVSTKNVDAHTEAIIMVNDAPLTNPEQKNKTISLLPEGSKAIILNEHNGSMEIRMADGRQGWIEASLVSKI